MDTGTEHTSDELLDSAWGLCVPVGRILGIDIRIHALVLLGILLEYNKLSCLKNILCLYAFLLFYSGLFLSILAHELGHALATKFFGNIVKGIIVFPPLGGMAFIQVDNERPIRNILIYLSGPAVNIVLAIILMYSYRHATMEYHFLIYDGLKLMMWVNLLIGLVNLIPFYPLDGGRILHNLILLFRYGERKANILTLCFSSVCFVAIVIYTLKEGYYFNLIIAMLLMIVSYLVLTEKPAGSQEVFEKVSLDPKLVHFREGEGPEILNEYKVLQE